jgi:hypothetical protein
MKKLILLLMLGVLSTQAQKTVKVYNYTANTVLIRDLVTRTATNTLPEFHSKPNGQITIAPYGSYTMVNTANATRFPFYSPTSLPVITTWERSTTTTPTSSIMPNTAAWLQGANQVFYWVNIGIGGYATTVGSPISGLPSTNSLSGTTVTYAPLGTTAAPIYTITIN